MERKPLLENYNPFGQLLIFIGLVMLSVVIAMVLSAMAVAVVLGPNAIGTTNVLADLSNESTINALRTSQFFASLATFILPVFLFGFFTSGNVISSLKLNKAISYKSALIVFLMVIASLPAINWIHELNQQLKLPEAFSSFELWMETQEKSTEKVVKAFLAQTSLLSFLSNLVVMAVIPAIGEELCFRGVMQKIFGKMFQNHHAAIWITAAIFSAIHLQFYGFVPRMLLGTMLGYLFYWSGSLWLPILAHFVNNGFAVLLSYLVGIGTLSKDVEEIGSGEGMILFAFASIFITLGFMFLIKRNQGLSQPLQDHQSDSYS